MAYLQFNIRSSDEKFYEVVGDIVDRVKNAWDVLIEGNIYLIITALALIFIGIGAYKYISASGEAEKTKTAKQTVINVIIGIVVVVGAYGLINAVRSISKNADEVVGEKITISDEPQPSVPADETFNSPTVIISNDPNSSFAFLAGKEYAYTFRTTVIHKSLVRNIGVPEEYTGYESPYRQGAMCQAEVNYCSDPVNLAFPEPLNHSCLEIMHIWSQVYAEANYCDTWQINVIPELDHYPVGKLIAYQKGGAIYSNNLSINSIKDNFATSDRACLQYGYDDAKKKAEGVFGPYHEDQCQ